MAQHRIELFGGLHVKVGNQNFSQFDTVPCAYLLAYLAYHHGKSGALTRAKIAEVIWPKENPNDSPRYNSLNDSVRRLRRQLCPSDSGSEDLFESTQLTLSLNANAVTTDVDDFETALERADRNAVSLEDRAQARIQALKLYRDRFLPNLCETDRERGKRPDFAAWLNRTQLQFARRYLKTVDQVMDHLAARGDFAAALEHAQNALRFHPDQEEAHSVREFADHLEREVTSRASLTLPQQALFDAVNGPAPPNGLVTFLMADVEAPSPVQQANSSPLPTMPDRYRAFLREALVRHEGYAVWDQNGSFLIAFSAPSRALNCAIECQAAFLASQTDPETSVGIRMALHIDETSWADGHYRGPAVPRVIAMAVAAHRGQILCSEVVATFLLRKLPQNTQLTDLGSYCLHGETEPEHLYQLAPLHPLLRFPAPRAAVAHRSRLPRPLNPYIGREHEIRELQALLSGGSRLITLTGSAGVGKTRLSQEVVRGLIDTYSGGLWFVPLANLLDAGSIAGAIQDAMGLASFPGLDPMEQVTSALGMGRSLLVLDNFEHLLQNSSDIAEAPLQRHGADVIRELLQRAPKLTCLITSRRRCNLSGERVFTLAPLPTPGRIRNIEALRRNESIRLFEDRARAVKRTFELTYDNAKIVAQLCHLLEGVPLAIEMAAAHIKTHRPEAVLEFVQSSRLERLEDRRSEAEKHHRTLIATFDWGYRLLSPDHQRLFRQLSAFYGGWTEEAAQEVCASDAANRLLDDLQEWSLLEACAEPTMGATTVRYAMLEMQRQYAEAQLEVEERKKLHERHAAFFHKFARSAQQGVNSPQQERWLRGLATEHSNLRAALKWAETSAPDLGLEIAVCLSQFWEIRNHWVEGYAALTNLLKAAEGAPAPLRAQALLAAGNLAKLLGKRDEARACLDASFLLCKDLNDNVLLAKVLNSLGILTQEEDRAEEACAFYQQSLQIKRDQDDVRGIAITLSNLGYAAYHNEDFSEARRALEEAVQILRTLNLKHALANALNNLGGVTLSEGDSENARLLLLESLTIRREIRNKQNIVYSLLEFARLAHAETDGERAVYLLGAAQRLCERTKCRLSVAEQARYDRFRAALGVLLTSASFDAAWRRGYNELLEQVLDDLSDHS